MRLSEVQIFKAQKRFLSVEMIPKHYFKMIFAQMPKMQKVPLFDQNHGLTPLENIEKCDYLKCLFLWARNDSFLSKRSSNIIFKIIFAQKQKMKKMLV